MLRHLRPARTPGLGAAVVLTFTIAGHAAVAAEATPAAPGGSLSGVETVPPPSAEADAETYSRCMSLARRDPAAAQRLAADWRRRGGAHPADHCAAVALISLGRYREAAGKLLALAQAMPAEAPASLRADVLDQAAQASLLAGDAASAYRAAVQAVALSASDPELLIDRAEAAFAAGYFDRALSDLDRVLMLSPDRVDALVYRASAYRALDRLDPARADVDKALSLAPASAAALLERGNIRRLQGDPDGARGDWERVGRLAPGSAADMAARANLERLAKAPVPPSATPVPATPAPTTPDGEAPR
jgi:tetratricopeptide (TPR) repeat protein